MKVDVFADPPALAVALAERVLDRVAARPSVVLGLPTGRTPRLLYAELRARTRVRGVSWSQVRTFNLDEFVGLGHGDRGSYRAYMQRELFAPVDLPAANVGFLDGLAPDLEAECARYEQAIEDAGGIDLLILGIGVNGHVGFNEPASGLEAATHRVRLTATTRAANAYLFEGRAASVPDEALTMGMRTILRARSIVLAATGTEKAGAVAGMRLGHVTTRVPASFLQLHPDVHVMLDAPAARTAP